MTVTYLGLWGRRATNDRGIRTYTRTYKLKTSDKNENEYEVGSNASLPIIGSVHPSDSRAYLRTLEVDNNEPWAGWLVTATYSTEFEMSDNPLNEPARITIDGEKYQEVAVTDYQGYGILNSAGDFFTEPPIMRERTNRIFTVSKNVSEIPSWLLTAEDAVNNAVFLIRGFSVAIRQARLDKISVSEQQERNGIAYYVLTMVIHCRNGTWDAKPLQCGYRQLVGGVLKKIVSEGDGTDISTPALLDASGVYIPNPVPNQAIYGSFRIFNEIDFNTLPLD